MFKNIFLIVVTSLLMYSPATGKSKIPTGKEALIKKAFSYVGKKSSFFVAELIVDGSREGYATMINGGWAITKSSLISSRSRVSIKWGSYNYSVELLGRDLSNDIIVMRIQSAKVFPGFTLVRKSPIALGQMAISVGTKGILKGGVVSALNRRVTPRKRKRGLFSIFGFLGLTQKGIKRRYKSLLQHDCPLDKGQFGSPLVDSSGNLLGINVASAHRGTGFAVSVTYLKKVLPSLKIKKVHKRTTSTKKGFLGVQIQQNKSGVMIAKVVRRSPAYKAGLKTRDIITHVNGRKVTSARNLVSIISRIKPGTKIKLTYRRRGRSFTTKVLLGVRK